VFGCVCSGFDNSIHVELYNSNDNIVTKMMEAGFAKRMYPSLDSIRFHKSKDAKPVSVTSATDEPVYIPG